MRVVCYVILLFVLLALLFFIFAAMLCRRKERLGFGIYIFLINSLAILRWQMCHEQDEEANDGKPLSYRQYWMKYNLTPSLCI